MTFLNSFQTLVSDAPRPWGLYFQNSASPQTEALVELHDNIMFYLIIILFSVGWIITSIAWKYVAGKSAINNKYVSHGTLVELIWTITPGFILIFISFTSFKLLYLMDDVSDINMTLYIEGHQWYWSYQYPDFLDNDGEFIEYDSYLVPESDLEDGALRMVDVCQDTMMPIGELSVDVDFGKVFKSYLLDLCMESKDRTTRESLGPGKTRAYLKTFHNRDVSWFKSAFYDASTGFDLDKMHLYSCSTGHYCVESPDANYQDHYGLFKYDFKHKTTDSIELQGNEAKRPEIEITSFKDYFYDKYRAAKELNCSDVDNNLKRM